MASVTVHQSSLNALTTCEQQWAYRYLNEGEGEGSKALWMGTAFHLLCQHYRGNGDPAAAVEWMVSQRKADPAFSDREDEALADATWLFERYVTHYGDERDKYQWQKFEAPFRYRLPGRHIWVQGTIDELALDHDGKLWVVERKTMADWSRLDYLINDPQVTIYFWAAKAMGLDPYGVLYDAARNYRWAEKNIHKYPPEVSFERRYLDRNQDHLDVMIQAVAEGGQRMLDLTKGRKPLLSIGMHCSWCPFKQPCLDDLAFPGQGSKPIVFDDEDEVVFE